MGLNQSKPRPTFRAGLPEQVAAEAQERAARAEQDAARSFAGMAKATMKAPSRQARWST